MTTTNSNKVTKTQAIHQLWYRGILSWKLKPHQKELYDLFHNTNHKVQTWLLARRSGKTHALAVIAIETCLKKPNSIIKFLSPTRLQCDTNLRPIIRTILSDCPEDIIPTFKKNDYVYYFNNGSEIQLAGSESGNVEKLRGGSSIISIIDEAQSVSDLSYAIKDVLLPTTLTTRGKILIAGTPSREPDHDFHKYIDEAEFRGSLVKKTIYDNTMLSTEQIEEIKLEVGGANSEEFRREFLCEVIKSQTLSVFPEFTPDLEKKVIKEWPKPPFYETYEAMDLGFKDMTVVLFAYYDFRANKVVIEDEIATTGHANLLPDLMRDIDKKEAELWTNYYTNELVRPNTRVSDINYIVTQEISRASNGRINFTPAKKDDKEAAVNKLRVLLSNEKIIINPRCKTLIRHLRNAMWNKSKKGSEFARSGDDSHFDAADACLYLIRAIAFERNPYPYGYDLNLRKQDSFLTNPEKAKSTTNNADIYKKIFKIKK